MIDRCFSSRRNLIHVGATLFVAAVFLLALPTRGWTQSSDGNVLAGTDWKLSAYGTVDPHDNGEDTLTYIDPQFGEQYGHFTVGFKEEGVAGNGDGFGASPTCSAGTGGLFGDYLVNDTLLAMRITAIGSGGGGCPVEVPDDYQAVPFTEGVEKALSYSLKADSLRIHWRRSREDHTLRVLVFESDQTEKKANSTSPVETTGRLDLAPNAPNPFRRATTLRYELPQAAQVRITVYDALGRRVATLTDEHRAAGVHRVRFDASDLPAGVYVARLRAGAQTATRTLTIAR